MIHIFCLACFHGFVLMKTLFIAQNKSLNRWIEPPINLKHIDNTFLEIISTFHRHFTHINTFRDIGWIGSTDPHIPNGSNKLCKILFLVDNQNENTVSFKKKHILFPDQSRDICQIKSNVLHECCTIWNIHRVWCKMLFRY